MPRDTRTGGVLESMVLPALDRGGYEHSKQVVIGKRLGGRSQKVDVLAWRVGSEQIPISLKWQQSSGTAEQKVPLRSCAWQKQFTEAPANSRRPI